MKYSVFLQDPFDLSRYWIWIGLGLILAAVILRLFFKFLLTKDIRLKGRLRSPLKMIRMFFSKRRHSKKIRKIESQFKEGTLDRRAAHQEMSREIRQFVQDVSGKPMESLVYSEIRLMGYPKLTRLIEDFYVPEFASTSDAQTEDMIQKSKELIKEWQ